MRKKKYTSVIWEKAPEIEADVDNIIKNAGLDWISSNKIHYFRSYNSKARAYARIWGLSKIWQLALNLDPTYIIEVISEKFDPLPQIRKKEVLIHELTHIPKNFSGSLIPHIRKRGKRNFHDKVRQIFNKIKT